MTPEIKTALALYVSRQFRSAHPDGFFDGPRWWPSDEEKQECCEPVRQPSRAWPYSLMIHCRSIGHVARLCKVDATELRAAIRADKIERAKKKATEAERINASLAGYAVPVKVVDAPDVW